MDLIDIRFHVTELFEQVVSSFPKELAHIIETQTYIAGGCFKSLVLDEKVNDYDFWFRTKEAADNFVSLLEKVEKTRSSELTNHDTIKLSKLLIRTDNALTFKFPKTTVQFILCEHGAPEEVVSKFDFRHTECYFDPVNNRLSCPTAFIISKTLFFNPKATTPLSALKRVVKFVKQGWDISDNEIEAIAKAITGVNWNDPVEVKKNKRGLYRISPNTAAAIEQTTAQILEQQRDVGRPRFSISPSETLTWQVERDAAQPFSAGNAVASPYYYYANTDVVDEHDGE